MIKFENTEVIGWEAAIRNIPAKGYRKTKNERYEAFVSNHSKSIFLGTYDTPKEAKKAVFNYRVDRFVSGIVEYNLNPDDGVVYENNYVVFSNGMIFNLHGERIVGHINRDGYINGIINRKNMQFHRIIASIFCKREIGKNYINHIDGNKQNNNADNLEWVTRSENAKHSFNTGLQNNISGIPIYTDKEKQFIKEHCFDHYKNVAKYLNRNPETVRKYMQKYRKEIKYEY